MIKVDLSYLIGEKKAELSQMGKRLVGIDKQILYWGSVRDAAFDKADALHQNIITIMTQGAVTNGAAGGLITFNYGSIFSPTFMLQKDDEAAARTAKTADEAMRMLAAEAEELEEQITELEEFLDMVGG